MSLNAEGIMQVQKLKRRISKIHFDVIVTSPAKRAKETCRLLFPNKTSINVHPGLAEQSFGAWEGLTHSEIQTLYTNELLHYEQDPFNFAPSGGEAISSVFGRVVAFYQEILSKYRGKTVAIVGHGGSLHILLCQIFGIKPLAHWQFHLKPASISQVSIYPNDQIVLELFNDTCHLEEKE